MANTRDVNNDVYNKGAKQASDFNKNDTGSQIIQFLVGFGVAAYHTYTGNKFYDTAVHTDPNRQKLHANLEGKKHQPNVIESVYSQNQISLIQGQNSAQSYYGQPMPAEAIPHFLDQVDRHAQRDQKSREKIRPDGRVKKQASQRKHAEIDMKKHEELSKVFGDNGYTSGQYLHKIGYFEAVQRRNNDHKIPNDFTRNHLESVENTSIHVSSNGAQYYPPGSNKL